MVLLHDFPHWQRGERYGPKSSPDGRSDDRDGISCGADTVWHAKEAKRPTWRHYYRLHDGHVFYRLLAFQVGVAKII